jgi:chemotaxis protein methyltransferase CheR
MSVVSTTPAVEHDLREFEFEARDFERARSLIYAHSGISLSPQKADLIYNRLTKRLRACGLRSFHDYLELVEADAHEFELFVNALTTNLTAFFREKHHFDVLAQYVRRRQTPSGLRIWCAASSTGEEPYSLAMTLAEVYGCVPAPVQLIATDLDTAVLATAASGVYPLERFERIPAPLLKRYFLRGTGRHAGFARASTDLRAAIEFCQLNLCAADWNVPQSVDVIFARNVLIYFDRETQLQILKRFHTLLGADAILVTGHSEILHYAGHLFAQVGRTVYAPVR